VRRTTDAVATSEKILVLDVKVKEDTSHAAHQNEDMHYTKQFL
jgi:hypothetical protein